MVQLKPILAHIYLKWIPVWVPLAPQHENNISISATEVERGEKKCLTFLLSIQQVATSTLFIINETYSEYGNAFPVACHINIQ